MSTDLIIHLGRQTLYILFMIAAPIMGLGLLVGLLVSILQAATQIQEQTLAFVPKILAVLLAVAIFAPWLLDLFRNYVVELYRNIPLYLR